MVSCDHGAGNVITSSSTEDAIAELGLTMGDKVTLFAKARDVLIGK